MSLKTVVLVSLLGAFPFVEASPKKHNNAATTKVSPSEYAANVSASAPTLRTFNSSQLHTPFTGTPTTTGALTASSIGTGISRLGVAPGATSYPADGRLHSAEPAPYVPAGGVGTNGSEPVYNTKSDFDYESLSLALYQEWIELDLFQDGLRRFSESDFQAAGLTSADRQLIAFMAQQEIGHVTMLSNILGSYAPQQCSYIFPYTNVREFIDFCQKLTRFGEAGVYGFLAHLDSREAATLLTQAITTEARQQLIFRQFERLFPMVEWFEVGIPQSWAWTLLAPFISSCPDNQTRLVWQNFPALMVVNQPNPWNGGSAAANSTSRWNQTSASNYTSSIDRTANFTQAAGYSFNQSTGANGTVGPGVSIPKSPKNSMPLRRAPAPWDLPGKNVGPNNSYITSTEADAGSARYVAWVSQLNITYTPLRIVNGLNVTNGTTTTNSTTNSTLNGIRGYTTQPNFETYQGNPAVNGTMFIAITDSDPFLSPFNLSLINRHVIAGPALYQAG
ncbi:hypothetical protein N7457_004241 [Penicillium paradoxum]|uniref:uncharacterized protein n=1 Tax=Penicillium paradoxum TaxID=176176 RepID=UPI00254851E4|nr:uncharacterized protein N7457_004241 [Penicillium paradoxum]KAJ5782467.1 hypothetical protein N7457_004241 [Penicillium paradoxum]